MDFNDFLDNLGATEKHELGGLDSQFKLAPEMRLAYNGEKIRARNPKKAAVLALFYPNHKNETCFLLTQRASYKGTHSGQISFPGGKVEMTDLNLSQTALRETFEEVGIAQENITILKEFTDVYIPPSNFLATPFVGYCKEKPIISINREVAHTIDVRLIDLLDDTNISSTKISNSYTNNIDVPCFKFNNYIVWGATAMILSEIKDFLK